MCKTCVIVQQQAPFHGLPFLLVRVRTPVLLYFSILLMLVNSVQQQILVSCSQLIDFSNLRSTKSAPAIDHTVCVRENCERFQRTAEAKFEFGLLFFSSKLSKESAVSEDVLPPQEFSFPCSSCLRMWNQCFRKYHLLSSCPSVLQKDRKHMRKKVN